MIRGIEHALGQRLWHFPGGVRLRHYKKMSISNAIDILPLPDSLTLSLNQSKGQVPPLQVAAGDHVKKYQRLTADLQGLGAHLHAPTSGTVTQVVTHGPNPCLMLDTDGADEGLGAVAFGGLAD